MAPRSRAISARFWEKVDKDGPVVDEALGPCWLWTRSLSIGGYGRFGVGRDPADSTRIITVPAHRWAYEEERGPIPKRLQLDHLCRVRRCVNPAHLEAVTPTENLRRSTAWDFNRNKTHCPAGHAYDEANTYWFHGWRECRACGRERTRAIRAARAS